MEAGNNVLKNYRWDLLIYPPTLAHSTRKSILDRMSHFRSPNVLAEFRHFPRGLYT